MRKIKSEPLSQVVRKMRMDAGFSTRKLASLVGVSHAAISQWEKEAEKLPYHRAAKIASVCGHTEAELDQLVGQSIKHI